MTDLGLNVNTLLLFFKFLVVIEQWRFRKTKGSDSSVKKAKCNSPNRQTCRWGLNNWMLSRDTVSREHT